ncbi:helix-turn-helix transcriptional regulator [Tissierella sp.]|uniref:helix-turn-helix transcriptional regulator n=1 Tax=Tissierella sp. TaxID=41274 RepID=UPI0030578F7D
MRIWLSNIRQQQEKTHEDVATGCNITRQFYSMIENGERTPSVSTAKKIASVLDFDWTRFYEEETINQ